MVPWIEIIAGVALILGLGLRGTAGVLFVMLIGFTGTIALRTMHEMQVEGTPFFEVAFPCGCAGVEDEIIWQKLIKNSGLILLALLIFLSDSRRYCLSALGLQSSTLPVPDRVG